MTEKFICKDCGSIGRPVLIMKGNGFLEVVLWLLYIVPGIIYSIWRRGSHGQYVCPNCGSGLMVPISSPVGKKMLTEQKN